MFLKIFVYLSLIGVFSIVSAKNIDGFRGLKWGDSSSKLNYKQTTESGTYIVQNENLAIGDGMATKISYSFYKDKFYSASIYYTGLLNYQSIRRAMGLKYDIDGKCSNNYDSTYEQCDGKDKKGNIYRSEWYNTDPGYGRIDIRNGKIFNELMKQYEKDFNEKEDKERREVKGL